MMQAQSVSRLAAVRFPCARVFRFQPLALVFSLFYVTSGSALEGQSQGFSLPLSDKVISIEVVLPSGMAAKASVRDGTMLTVQDEKAGYLFGFVHYIANGVAFIVPFELTNLPKGGQRLKQMGKAPRLSNAERTKVETRVGGFFFLLLDIGEWEFPNIRPPNTQNMQPAELRRLYGTAGGGICCVSCNEVTLCGTAGDMECGICESVGATGLR